MHHCSALFGGCKTFKPRLNRTIARVFCELTSGLRFRGIDVSQVLRIFDLDRGSRKRSSVLCRARSAGAEFEFARRRARLFKSTWGGALPSSSILNFTDPGACQEAIRGGQVELLVTKGGDYRTELTKVALNRISIDRFDETLPRILRGAVSPNRAAIGFLTDWDQPEVRHCGVSISPGEIMVDDRHAVHHTTNGPSRWGSISLTLEDLAVAGVAVVGRPVTAPSLMRVIRPSAQSVSRLLRLHEAGGRLAKTAPEILANPEVGRALENEIIHAMIVCLTDNTNVERSIGNLRHSMVMARLEEFLAEHERVPLYVAEVCRFIGVSERTLRACCSEQLGVGPIRYLWLRRMHLARRALVQAQPGTSTVTGIAANYGFWEFGRFSVEYRALFGVSPSETLQQPPREFAPTAAEIA